MNRFSYFWLRDNIQHRDATYLVAVNSNSAGHRGIPLAVSIRNIQVQSNIEWPVCTIEVCHGGPFNSMLQMSHTSWWYTSVDMRERHGTARHSSRIPPFNKSYTCSGYPVQFMTSIINLGLVPDLDITTTCFSVSLISKQTGGCLL